MLESRLPNFFILGAAKAGTTSLYEYLKSHPDIFLSTVKEPQFFSRNSRYEKGLEYYTDTFFQGSQKFPARGEATPHYIYFEKVAKRLSEILPERNRRFIVILRDPIKRAHSLYWNMVAEGVEKFGFEDALAMEASRLADNSFGFEQEGTIRFQYVDSGLYAKQLKLYFKYFSTDCFLVLFFEDLMKDRKGTLKKICQFLHIEYKDEYFHGMKTFNKAGMPKFRFIHDFIRKPNSIKKSLGLLLPHTLKYKIASKVLDANKKEVSYPPLDDNLKLILRDQFENDIMELEVITGKCLKHWLQG